MEYLIINVIFFEKIINKINEILQHHLNKSSCWLYLISAIFKICWSKYYYLWYFIIGVLPYI